MSRHPLRSTAAAVLLLVPVAASFAAQPAATQQKAAQPSITRMSINSDAGLSAGATLRVQVSAPPNAKSASVTLGNSGVTVPLQQQSAGNYAGTYVVRRADRIDPMQRMIARVSYGDRTYSREFNFPAGFQALAMGNAPQVQPQQQARQQPVAIERFVMRSARPLEPGRELRFRVFGAPGADASIDIPGVVSGLGLDEVRPGVYEGSYTIRRRDDPDAFRTAVATLRRGDQRATSRLGLGLGDDDRIGRDDRDDRDNRYAPPDRYGAGSFPLEVTSYRDHAVVDANGNLAIQGRTAPFANVRVQVDSASGMVADQSVQADGSGRFGVLVSPRNEPFPGQRFDVRITASTGDRTAEERLTLFQRQG